MAVDKLLVANESLPVAVVYDLADELARLQPALRALSPSAFQTLDNDDASYTFRLHPGARDYLQRDEPGLFERYSGIAEVLVTALIGAVSGTFAVLQIYNRRRKNRIDRFYVAVMAIRNREVHTEQQRAAAMDELHALEEQAFAMLVKEELAADESFRIFTDLVRDTTDTLSASPSESV